MPNQLATFGAGCFWGSEAYFRGIDGVIDTRVGHSTGTDGSTDPGRIEVVQVDFDPTVLSYRTLIELFWKSHDPTAFDRQGDEAGEGVRSAIFTHDSQQYSAATELKAHFNANSPLPATTQVIPFVELELADEKHQRYVEKNGYHACSIPAASTRQTT
ncbi:peptide-methionine (S)-S-oxide reductase MsrA [Rhizobium sp. S163]|uniref:peptide-methionine (S)-S-oxide reductase MsrA n=1 Tax=Rhizobium sp. S163 TaxID=3055039 RepID=UPI0025A9B3BC|nr:peptide-methionine (S)-S-oxide reductase MsrA [Rhizobium sp. S163]MDM9648373.1 peptide-methionine (S)-S-oxide reductase MsrA [Rhizobium sp. S163]